MTVLTDTMTISHVGDAIETEFAYDFKIFSSDELDVYIDSVLQTTGYTVSGVGEDAGGAVTFSAPPGSGLDVQLTRNVELTQLVDYRPDDPFPAETHEKALDRIVMMIQQVNYAIGYVLGTTIENLMAPDYAAGEYWRWDSATQTIVTDTPVATTASAASDGEVAAGTGTDPRVYTPAQLKLAVETHQHKIENVAALPGTPDPNTIYLVD